MSLSVFNPIFVSFVTISSSLMLLFNVFTAKFSQKQISTKFHFVKFCKTNSTMCKYRKKELSLEWSHHRLSSAD